MTAAALTAKEFGWTWSEFLHAEPCRTNAFLSVLSEYNGLVGRWTYRDVEIRRYLPQILSGKMKY